MLKTLRESPSIKKKNHSWMYSFASGIGFRCWNSKVNKKNEKCRVCPEVSILSYAGSSSQELIMCLWVWLCVCVRVQMGEAYKECWLIEWNENATVRKLQRQVKSKKYIAFISMGGLRCTNPHSMLPKNKQQHNSGKIRPNTAFRVLSYTTNPLPGMLIMPIGG